MLNKEHEFTRTQDSQENYYDAGQMYFLNVKSFLEQKKIFMNNIYPVILDAFEGLLPREVAYHQGAFRPFVAGALDGGVSLLSQYVPYEECELDIVLPLLHQEHLLGDLRANGGDVFVVELVRNISPDKTGLSNGPVSQEQNLPLYSAGVFHALALSFSVS